MNVQSLSIAVPAGCANKCKFCVASIHRDDDYQNQIEKNRRFRDLYVRDYMDRMSFARDNGCNTMILTGDGEPLMNMKFLEDVATWNAQLSSPFRWIELQTSGVGLDDEKLRWLRNTIRVSTISLSLSNIFDSNRNAEINGTPKKLKVDIEKLTAEIKRYDFNLRLSLNLTSDYNNLEKAAVFTRAKALGANQVTFRVLYSNGADNPASKWVEENKVTAEFVAGVNEHIKNHGHKLEVLPFGATRYAVNGISCVVDDDCMSTAQGKETIKYLVLRANAKLYTRWDDTGSILF
jgi:sulfatase maturation enzyme AslB (radical SAM superfamily)